MSSKSLALLSFAIFAVTTTLHISPTDAFIAGMFGGGINALGAAFGGPIGFGMGGFQGGFQGPMGGFQGPMGGIQGPMGGFGGPGMLFSHEGKPIARIADEDLAVLDALGAIKHPHENDATDNIVSTFDYNNITGYTHENGENDEDITIVDYFRAVNGDEHYDIGYCEEEGVYYDTNGDKWTDEELMEALQLILQHLQQQQSDDGTYGTTTTTPHTTTDDDITVVEYEY